MIAYGEKSCFFSLLLLKKLNKQMFHISLSGGSHFCSFSDLQNLESMWTKRCFPIFNSLCLCIFLRLNTSGANNLCVCFNCERKTQFIFYNVRRKILVNKEFALRSSRACAQAYYYFLTTFVPLLEVKSWVFCVSRLLGKKLNVKKTTN